jgi:DNA-directed RNA polymerase I, II, and III subunit RPABC1
MEMLRDRDYVVAEFELAFTKEAFREKYGDEPKREDLVIQKPKRSNTAEHVSFVCAPCNFYLAVKGLQGR